MNLSAAIAWRYLWKKKSHGAVSAIAIVSVVGVAVATAALICVLSVFNGFRKMLVDRNDKILPDIEITSVRGKVIADGDSLAEAVGRIAGVEISSPVVADQALAIYGMREMPVMLRGVEPAAFREYTGVDSLLRDGAMMGSDAIEHDPPLGMPAIGVVYKLKCYEPGSPVFLFAPRREGTINPANPLASFFTDSISVSGIVETQQSDIDLNSVYVPIEVARGLFQYDREATSIAVKAKTGVDAAELGEKIFDEIGDGYQVRDRARQQEMGFRMVEIEKWVTGVLLVFILVIASFNIISTLTMFVLEKRRQIRTLTALGMSRRRVGAVFGWESMYITAGGALAGMISGVGLTLLQEKFGYIKLQGDEASMLIQAYPVELQWSDLLIVLVPVMMIGMFTSLIASSFARSRISGTHR